MTTPEQHRAHLRVCLSCRTERDARRHLAFLAMSKRREEDGR